MARDVEFGIRIKADSSGFVGETKQAEQAVDRFTTAQKKAAAETEQTYARLNSSITTRLQTMQLEEQAGRKLFAGEALHLRLVNDLASGRIRLTDAQQHELRGKVEAIKQIEAESAARTRLAASTDQVTRVSRVAAAAVAAFAVGAAAALKSEISALDDLVETAQGLGTTAVALANLRIGFQELGVGAGQFDSALNRLNNRLADARRGGKESLLIFEALGFDMTRVRDGSINAGEALRTIAERFRTYRDGAGEANLATELFGREIGRKMVPALNQGGDALERTSGLTAETVKSAVRLQNEIDKLTASSIVFKNQGLGVVVPALNEFIALVKQVDLGQVAREFTISPLAGALTFQSRLNLIRQAERERERSGALLRIENQFRGEQGQVEAPNIGDLARAQAEREKAAAEARKAAERAAKEALRRAEEEARLTERLSQQATQATLAHIQALTREAGAIDEANTRLREQNEEIGKSVFAVDELRTQRLEDAIAVREQTLAMGRLSEATDAEIKAMERQIELLKQQVDLRRQGSLGRQADATRQEINEAAKRSIQEQQEASREVGRILADSLMRGFESGKGFARNFADTLANYIKTRITQALAESLIQSLFAELAGGKGSSGAFEGIGNAFIGLFGLHSGGVVGQEASFMRAVPARTVRNAPRYHRGAVSGDEEVAILRRGEGVFTPQQMARLAPAGGGVTVNIINKTDAQVTARQGDDGMSIEVLIDRMEDRLAGNIASNRGSLGGAIQNRFALRPAAV